MSNKQQSPKSPKLDGKPAVDHRKDVVRDIAKYTPKQVKGK